MLTLFYRLLVVLLLTAIGAAAGYGLSYSQTEKWKVTAQLEQPVVPDLGNYYSLLSTYSFLNTNSQDANLQKDVLDEVYTEFKRNLTSADLLQNYLAQTEAVKLKAQLENKSPAMMASQLAAHFSFAKDPAISADNFSFVSENPEEAQKLLSEFILLANSQAREKLNADLIAKWKVLFQQIKAAAELNLGAQGANGQDWNGKLQMMRSVQPLDNALTSYRLVKSPTIPLNPESPDRWFWLMIGALSGLLLGFMASFAVKARKQQIES